MRGAGQLSQRATPVGPSSSLAQGSGSVPYEHPHVLASYRIVAREDMTFAVEVSIATEQTVDAVEDSSRQTQAISSDIALPLRRDSRRSKLVIVDSFRPAAALQ